MYVAYVVVTVVTILANTAIAVADLLRARFVMANSAAVRVPESWVTTLGLLKAAGAAGLLLGLLGMRVIGVAAAVGLVLFFVGAVVVHIRARAFRTLLPGPGVFLALAVASLGLAVAQ